MQFAGAFSVISSVLAIVIAMFWGITATLVVGLSAYVVALLMLKAGAPMNRAGSSD